jgi:outer membrane protein
MKQTVVMVTVLFIALLGFFTEGFSADVAKIGVVNFETIMKNSSAGKMVQKQISEKGAELQKKLESEKTQLDELKKSFEREALVLSPEKQQEKQREFRIRVNDFKKMQEDFSREFKQLEVKLLNEMQKSVFEIANEIGKEEGYLLILEKKTAGIIYHPEQIDMTEKIIKKYNLKVSKTQ